MVFMVIAATAPLTALASNIALSLGSGVGVGTVAAFLIVAVVLAVFAVGYLRLARSVRSAGGQAAFVTFGLGRRLGAAVAFIATVAYNLAAAGMAVATGFYLSISLAGYTGVVVPWPVFAFLAIGAIALLGTRGSAGAQRVTLVASLLQFVLIAVLALAVSLVRPQGWTLEPFDPGAALQGNVALTLVFVLLSYGGFEASVIYSEEAKSPRSVSAATYISLGALAVIFALATWTLTAAVPDVVSSAAEDPGALVSSVADRYLGTWSGDAINVLIAVSFFGAAIAFHNLATRYQFALGRAGLLPRALARTSTRNQSPWVSALVQTALSVAILLPFVIADADVFGVLFPAISGITSLSLMTMMILSSLSVIVAKGRGRISGGVWATIVAPTFSVIALGLFLFLIGTNYGLVTGSDALVFALMPLIPLAAAVYGAVRQWRLKDGPGLEGFLAEADD
jgi:amino acid transporter